MLDSGLTFLFYVAIKYAAYAGWCFVGIRWLGAPPATLRSALGAGAVRLLLGVFFGLAIFLAGGMMHLNVPEHPWFSYFMIYAPVRWVEWSIMSLVLGKGPHSVGSFLFGASNQERLWRLGGVVVSHLADTPLIVSGTGVKEMLPVGRFLC
jgi:hypothetical protein